MAETPVEVLFGAIGSPLGGERRTPSPQQVDACFDFAFNNRVGLLFLERCFEQGVALSPSAQENRRRLIERRERTEQVMIRLAEVLQQAAPDRWVLFKSVKPFPSTPNDTDWFPFDRKDHPALVDLLLRSGFAFLEKAPMQTTLVEESGVNVTHSDKRGGVYYIDCYVAPAADYFIYLDPAKLRSHFTYREVQGHRLPALDAPAELIAILFHNVFPERTYSIESFYLVLHYLAEIDRAGRTDAFIAAVQENHVARAASANLAVTAALHRRHFGSCPENLARLFEVFPAARKEALILEESGYALPYHFSNPCFWRCFADKLRDPISLWSAMVQATHMLNPLFFADVVRITWRRTRKDGVYEQM